MAGFSVVADAEDGNEAVNLTTSLHPDVLLLDVQMPFMDGFTRLREILTKSPGTRIVLLTGSIQSSSMADAFTSGARGVILKEALTEQIATAVLSVMQGYFWVQGRRIEHLSGVLAEVRNQVQEESQDRYNLTPRELDVVSLIVKGLSNRDIAKHFNLSEETVKRHLSNIFGKLGISTRLELAIFAISHKLVNNENQPGPTPG